MSNLNRRLLRLALPLVIVALSGCGQKKLSKKETFPVKGRLVLGGEPVRFALIHFIPTDPAKGIEADGKTDQDGVFTLRTYSNEDPDGAAPGEYRITLEEYDSVRVGSVPSGTTPTKIPPMARKPGTTVEVKSEDNDLGDINLD